MDVFFAAAGHVDQDAAGGIEALLHHRFRQRAAVRQAAAGSAAIAAAEAMPAWAPATKEGQPIATTITLPIFFKQ